MDNENYNLIEINCSPTLEGIVLEKIDINNEFNRLWFDLSAIIC